MMLNNRNEIEAVLSALAEQLAAEGEDRLSLLLCGGAALNFMGYINRTTRDVDILALVEEDEGGKRILLKADPLKQTLLAAASRVQRDFDLPDNWLNAGPASLVDLGLPAGVMDRVETHRYGKSFIVHFLGRYDQIHLKLYAVVDQAAGKHLDDLLALKPTNRELEEAARWCMTQDSSRGFKIVLKQYLEHLGFTDVSERL